MGQPPNKPFSAQFVAFWGFVGVAGGGTPTPVTVKMPPALATDWPSGLITVTVRVPGVAPPVTVTLSVTWVESV